eukprot:CAMPEP_0114499954 /NCGR_PEP_ID=MMETSP0109-20121206/7698_1 /TAXON_ID=29199 /ORGANISM="Chlorarachnion reptans, Strain CCCM449" /LENGTH=439 /DNA_ID=CAMNT_0001677567 /DNA_START=65 /DNA_END=1384 /DNA_ORIENTATION=-
MPSFPAEGGGAWCPSPAASAPSRFLCSLVASCVAPKITVPSSTAALQNQTARLETTASVITENSTSNPPPVSPAEATSEASSTSIFRSLLNPSSISALSAYVPSLRLTSSASPSLAREAPLTLDPVPIPDNRHLLTSLSATNTTAVATHATAVTTHATASNPTFNHNVSVSPVVLPLLVALLTSSTIVPANATVAQQRHRVYQPIYRESTPDVVAEDDPMDNFTKEQFFGTAYKDEKRKEVLFVEKHSVVYDAVGRPLRSVIEYLRGGGCNAEVFASLRSDFTRDRNISIYEFHHMSIGWKEGVDYEDGRYVMFQSEDNHPYQTKELPNDLAALFAGQGWHYYLLERLDDLAHTKGTRKIHLAFPAHLATYPFALKKEWRKGDLLKLSLSFDSWIVSFFAPKIFLTYDLRRRKLLSFTGPSHIYDENGKIQNVHVTYDI